MSEIEEITPNPYINGWLSDNSDVSYMAKVYPAYTDIVTFKGGNPDKCIRIKPRQDYQRAIEKIEAINGIIGYCQSLKAGDVITEGYMQRMNDYYIPKLEAILKEAGE